eukprot:TRINITY_DN8688_c0_g1_i1.p1 TRINITY_DN8688_c0_g1~~TRINITY_DN8688_c0_g1_i1.p1  ORF type:complete len:160 (+),score=40.05 TRINITY_DN8688_c0_g1_i1:59-538(+)
MGCGSSKKGEVIETRDEKKKDENKPNTVQKEPEKSTPEKEKKPEQSPPKAAEPEPKPKPRQIPDRETILKAIQESKGTLQDTLEERKAKNLPCHVSEDPMLALIFMGSATQIGQKYGVETTDLLTIEDTYKDDDDVMKKFAELKELLDSCGLPSSMPKA